MSWTPHAGTMRGKPSINLSSGGIGEGPVMIVEIKKEDLTDKQKEILLYYTLTGEENRRPYVLLENNVYRIWMTSIFHSREWLSKDVRKI